MDEQAYIMFSQCFRALRVESRPSRQLCVCEADQDRGGRAGALQVKGQERPESRVCAHTVHLKSF